MESNIKKCVKFVEENRLPSEAFSLPIRNKKSIWHILSELIFEDQTKFMNVILFLFFLY